MYLFRAALYKLIFVWHNLILIWNLTCSILGKHFHLFIRKENVNKESHNLSLLPKSFMKFVSDHFRAKSFVSATFVLLVTADTCSNAICPNDLCSNTVSSKNILFEHYLRPLLCNWWKMDIFNSKLAYFILSVTNTLA